MSEQTAPTPMSGGVPVTDELVNRLVEEAEAGYDVELLRRRGGRRPITRTPAR